MEDTGLSGSLAILNGNDIERTWGDGMVDVNVMGSDISQGTDDYSAGLEDATKEWRTPENYINMSMGSNIVYTWASNTIYVMINGSEDGQFESLTGSTSAIMSKETRDQKTLSVADPLNRDRDTINNSVNRTIGDELTAIHEMGSQPMGVMETTDMLGNRVEVRMVKRYKSKIGEQYLKKEKRPFHG